VAVTVYHFTAVFSVVLQFDCNVTVEFANEKIQWFSRRFQYYALMCAFPISDKNSLLLLVSAREFSS